MSYVSGLDYYLYCNGCKEVFHAMNYVAAYEHGAQSDWCGEKGFILTAGLIDI